MRLKITLEHDASIIVPWDYQYAIQQWIYQTISKADDTLATMLHDHGYGYEGKSFKLFSFGPWSCYPYDKIKDVGMRFRTSKSFLEISSCYLLYYPHLSQDCFKTKSTLFTSKEI